MTQVVSWVHLANDGESVFIPAGSEIRFGVGTTWSPVQTVSTAGTYVCDVGLFGNVDPAPGQTKTIELKVLSQDFTTRAQVEEAVTMLSQAIEAVNVFAVANAAKLGTTSTQVTNLTQALSALEQTVTFLQAGSLQIQDSTVSSSTVWSSSKSVTYIAAQILDAVSALETKLVAGAPGALDTLNELAVALTNADNVAAALVNVVATKVSYTEVQNLTTAQKAMGRANLGAVSMDEVQLAIGAVTGDLGTMNLAAIISGIITPLPAV